MIRDKTKIYGEPNLPYVVTVEPDLIANKYVVTAGSRKLKPYNPGGKRIMTTDINGNVSSFNHNQPNKLVGVDQNGQLTLFPKIPTEIPTGRVLVVDKSGADNLDGPLRCISVTLEAPYYYEIEISGAGGGGGGGIGRNTTNIGLISGTDGGDGGYYKGIFLLPTPTIADICPGNAGGRGGGLIYVKTLSGINISGVNYGGEGGRSPHLYVGLGGHGSNPVADIAYAGPEYKAGGIGINGGANGGDVRSELGNVGNVIGIGGSGGGANGPYGGNGGKSIYINNTGLFGAGSGGGGGAGGGFGYGGNGGGNTGVAVIGYGVARGGGSGGAGFGSYDNPGDSDFSAGGGGGGGGSRFVCGNIQILCGGGGGGAGAGYGGINKSTNGGHGINNINDEVGGANNKGIKGPGLNIASATYNHDCRGTRGGVGRIRIWRCV